MILESSSNSAEQSENNTAAENTTRLGSVLPLYTERHYGVVTMADHKNLIVTPKFLPTEIW